MTKQEFITAVVHRLPPIPAESAETFSFTISRQYSRGFSIDDCVAWHLCTEELNPDLSEDTALRRMQALDTKYPL